MNAAGKRKVKSKPKSKTFKTALIITLGIFLLLLVAVGIKIYEDVFADNINLETNKKGYLLVYTNKSLTENAELIKQNGVLNLTSIPTSAVGLSSGDIYSNAGILTIVP